MSTSNLNPDKALIFRITHIDNIPWVLDNGIHCRNSACFDPNFRNIGKKELIAKRHHRKVPVEPFGTLSDYVPFYFTPFSMMMYNIHTGYGVNQVPNEKIVVMVSSLPLIAQRRIPFVFTNQHAYCLTSEYFNDLDHLDQIDWSILQNRNFKHDPEDPEKTDRYQAEALIHQHVPLDALLGICCHSGTAKSVLQKELAVRNVNIRTVVQPNWYF